MTVPAQSTLFNESVANGLTTSFPYEFKIASADDVTVELDGVAQSTGFTVTGVGEDIGGSIVFDVAPTNGVVILRYLDPLLNREENYPQFGDFNADVVNLDFDRIWLALQALGLKLGLCVRAPISSASGVLPEPVANNVIGWNAAANGFQNYAPVDNSLLSAALAASSGSSLVGFLQGGSGASTTTVQAKLRESVSVKDFGAVGDGIADDTLEIQNAINSLTNGGLVIFPPGVYKITSGLIANAGVLIFGGQRYDQSSNTNGSGSSVKTSIVWGSLAAGYMFTITPSVSGNVIWGGGSVNIEWNGNDAAACAVHFDNTKYATFDGKVRQVTYAGVLVDSQSGSIANFSMKNHIKSLEFVWGTAPACQGANGLVLSGNGTTVPSTQQLIGDVSGLVYNGHLVRVSETDNAQFQSVHASVQSGGTGGAIQLINAGAQPSNHNVFAYVVGPVHIDNGLIGNNLLHYISEGGGITQSAGSSQWHGELQDYVSGERFKSRVYKLRDSMSIPSGSFVGDAATGLGDVGIQWRTISFPDAATSSASVLIPAPYEYGGGVLESVDFIVSTNGTSNGNYRLNVTASTAAAFGSLVTPDVTVLQTYSAGSQYAPNTINVSLSSLAFVKGDIICIRLQRIGADALDTNSDAMLIIGAKLNYRSNGPVSAGSGTYTIPAWA